LPTVQELVDVLEDLAPRIFALPEDPGGLQFGHPKKTVRRVLIALEIDHRVLAEAEAKEADLLVVHHPPIFRPLYELRTDRGNTILFTRILVANRAVYAMHTNYDAAPGGMNDVLARRIGLQKVRPFGAGGEARFMKVVVFVPESHARVVLEAMGNSGAGHIGNYDHAAFLGRGTGTFRPLSGANPFVGEVGQLEEVEERRLEMIVPEERLSYVLAAMRQVHPYEEVAYDVYPLREPRREVGLGRIGELDVPMTLDKLVSELVQRLARTSVRVVGSLEQLVRRVAVVAGAGSSWAIAAREAGADVLITGDVGYHRAREALDAGIAVVDVGHDVEEIFVPEVAAYLRQISAQRAWDVEVHESGVRWNPFVTISSGVGGERGGLRWRGGQ